MFLFLCLVLRILTSVHPIDIGAASLTRSDSRKEGLIIIPGVGRADRLKTVVHNLQAMRNYLEGASATWDCLIFTYAPRNDTSFWSNQKEIEFITNMCDIYENPGKRVAENIYIVHPLFIERAYKHMFILFDDCKLVGKESFPLQRIIRIMQYNSLTIASPRVIGANKGGGQAFRSIMRVEQTPGMVFYLCIIYMIISMSNY
jgi:hypothetical protein